MNIKDDVDSLLTMSTTLTGYFNSTATTSFKAVYIHANRNVTLAQSKSYSFGNSGLGGVIIFTNETIRSYYQSPAYFNISFTPQYTR